jgi:hypothetical protein
VLAAACSAVVVGVWRREAGRQACCMDIPGTTTQVGTSTDYSVGPWDYSTWAAQHLLAWSARTTEE